jgi:hypothetical protein
VKPLQQLLDAFHSPGRLIQKRTDKLLDYSASSQKAEKNKDTSKNRIVSIEDLNLFPTIQFSKISSMASKPNSSKAFDFFYMNPCLFGGYFTVKRLRFRKKTKIMLSDYKSSSLNLMNDKDFCLACGRIRNSEDHICCTEWSIGRRTSNPDSNLHRCVQRVC